MRFQFSILLAFTSTAYAAVQPKARHRVKEAIDAPPVGWIQSHPAHPDHVIHLSIALLQSNVAELERHLFEVSTPSHSRYGSHLSKEEVQELVRPTQESVEAVEAWLASHGLTSDSEDDHLVYSPSRDWVTVKVPVSVAEEMLNTKYHVWTHGPSGDSMVRTTEYSVPHSVHSHINLIQPTTMFLRFNSHKGNPLSTRAIPSNNDANVTSISLAQIKALYNATDYVPKATTNNAFGIVGYDNFWDVDSDIQAFLTEQYPAAVGSSYKLVSVMNGTMSQDASEATIQTAITLQLGLGSVLPTPTIFYSVGGQAPEFIPDGQVANNTNEPYLDWLNYVLSLDSVPQTIITSYFDDEDTVPLAYAQRVCAGFAQLGARGVSVIFAAGDFGAGDGNPDPSSQLCQSTPDSPTAFVPQFPATCPYVTVVGATTGVNPEVAAPFTSGGFSNYFPRPSYQDAVVVPYLTQIDTTYAGLYNASGRAFPDIAAQGFNVPMVFQGQQQLSSGTAVSATVVAGLVSLLNDARLDIGLPPLGFLNPSLYGEALSSGSITDIISGNAPGCGTQGFSAINGYDAVTGLGTLQFGSLLKLAAPSS